MLQRRLEALAGRSPRSLLGSNGAPFRFTNPMLLTPEPAITATVRGAAGRQASPTVAIVWPRCLRKSVCGRPSRQDHARIAALIIAVVVVAVAMLLGALAFVCPQTRPPILRTRAALFPVEDLGWKAPRWLRDYVQFCREPDTNTTQYLVWSSTGHYSGGAGDRSRGMLTAFYLAVGTGRKLRLHASDPVDIRLILQPAWIDWFTGAKELLRQVGSSHSERLHGSEDLLEFAARTRHDRVASYFSSAMELYPLYSAPQFAGRFAPVPDDPIRVGPDNWDVLATWSWTVLFRETSAVSAEIGALRRDAGLHGPFIGVHVRRGGHWGDGLRHGDVDVVRKFADCAANVSAALDAELIFYAASDDVDVKRQLQAALAPAAVRYDPRPPEHLQHVWSFESYLRTWAEFLLLRQSTCIVASHSGYSLWPVATSRDPRTGARCWAQFDLCSSPEIQRAMRSDVPIYKAFSANDPAFEL